MKGQRPLAHSVGGPSSLWWEQRGDHRRLLQGGDGRAGACRLSWSSPGKTGGAGKGNGTCKGPEAGRSLIILKGLKGGPNEERGRVWGMGRRGDGDILDHITDFCPYPRRRRNLRRVFKMKQDEELKALGEGPATREDATVLSDGRAAVTSHPQATHPFLPPGLERTLRPGHISRQERVLPAQDHSREDKDTQWVFTESQTCWELKGAT